MVHKMPVGIEHVRIAKVPIRKRLTKFSIYGDGYRNGFHTFGDDLEFRTLQNNVRVCFVQLFRKGFGVLKKCSELTLAPPTHQSATDKLGFRVEDQTQVIVRIDSLVIARLRQIVMQQFSKRD